MTSNTPASRAHNLALKTLGALAAAAFMLAGCALQAPTAQNAQPLPDRPATGVQQAWVQAVAGPAWAVRALTTEAGCPSLRWAGGSTAMRERSAPADEPPPPGQSQSDSKPSRFTLRACEAVWPTGAARVQLGTLVLQAPAAELRRVVVIGDTGCRLKGSEAAYQACNDAAGWPFPRVLAQALALKPDLIVHVGDYHYRESPCPALLAGCAGSPWGYGDDAWQADFFGPARALLAATPWVFVRGNHEACSRAGQGWLRYLDAETGTARACDPAGGGSEPGARAGVNADVNAGNFTAPFTVPLTPQTQLIVFDSSEVGSRTPAPDSPAWARWRQQLDAVATLARGRAQSFFVNHHPSLAFNPSLIGTATPTKSGLTPLLQASQPGRLYPPGVDATLHGHLHLHEALGFATGQPASFVVGNGGSVGYGHINAAAALRAEIIPGAQLETFDSHTDFGLTLLTAQPAGWQVEALDSAGQRVADCQLAGARLRCARDFRQASSAGAPATSVTPTPN